MAITAKGRARIAPENFALPGKRYPVNTPARARNALARIAQHGTPAEQRKVQNKVARRYPGIEVTKNDRKK
ncbi:hypothetical protein AB4Y36_38080 [Paraburkholderia sp. BR10936]|uniref:hypothetical protein n=1 Tax=Paraburkholderia sp. BR10936 TaxID=3236993 RepID=UPI0034D1D50D